MDSVNRSIVGQKQTGKMYVVKSIKTSKVLFSESDIKKVGFQFESMAL